MKKIKIPIIEHENFISILNKNPEIFKVVFGANKFGMPLLKFSTLVSRINIICERLIQDYSDIYKDDVNEPGSGLNKFKGDIFEIFINGLLLLKGSDARISIYNYSPEEKKLDWGVDGYGIGNDNNPLTVQIKYRSDATLELVSKDIGHFPYQSIVSYGVNAQAGTNIVLITSCKGLHPITSSKVLCSSVRVINGETIKNMIDDNTIFWKDFSDIINNTIAVKLNKKILKLINESNSTELIEE